MNGFESTATGDLVLWRADSRRQPRPDAVVAARSAMLRAVASAPARPRRLGGVLASLGLHPRTARHLGRPMLISGAAAAVAVGIVAAGWNAPAGSPLHDVSLTRERVELSIPGSDGLALRLGFAEQRLADAAAGHDPADSLAEAAALLTAVRAGLPADQGAPDWVRWRADEAHLAALRAAQPAPSQPATPAPRAEEPGAAPSAGGGEPDEHSGAAGGPIGAGHSSAPSASADPGEGPEGGPSAGPGGSFVSPTGTAGSGSSFGQHHGGGGPSPSSGAGPTPED